MAILHFSSHSPSSASLLLSSTSIFYSTPLFPPKRFPYFSSNQHTRSNSFNPSRELSISDEWRIGVSFFAPFSDKSSEIDSLKQQLFDAIAPLDRGAAATPDDQRLVDQIARKLEALNRVKEPLKSSLLNGKWELLYTTSKSLLQTEVRDKFPTHRIHTVGGANFISLAKTEDLQTKWKNLPSDQLGYLEGPKYRNLAIFQSVFPTAHVEKVDENLKANLVPLNQRRVAVKFDSFKIGGVIPINARGSGRGQLEITYLDEELRISRGNEGNLFILKMVDALYRVPV